ncbi:MAG: ribulose-phosphate 3-epimerase [Lentisphaeraceae bacterium]|nr:ribulose-phosphate 3-epimerase [Lentisphaeraceae bacterium]
MAATKLGSLDSRNIILSPSILAADFTELGKEVSQAVDAGAELLHIDVMDGHFVPNISVGIPVVKSLRNKFNSVFDVHLMLTEPHKYIDAFADAGADNITFHVESEAPIKETIDAIHAKGLSAGLTMKPGTSAESVKPYLKDIEMVLVMTVEPGFGGQSFMEDMLPKIKQIREWADEENPGLHIEVDGGIAKDTSKLVKEAGANVLVAGTAFFRHPDGMGAASQELRS